jgi:hypothetical protein
MPFGIPIMHATSHHSQTLTDNKIAPLVPCKSTRIHFHHLTSSLLAPEEKNPKAMVTRESNPSRRAALHQRSIPFESKFSVNPLFCSRLQSHDPPLFVSSLDLLPEEIFGTEEVPEYILSDSSAEEEDATPEQRTNYQLRRRIRHLEHNL